MLVFMDEQRLGPTVNSFCFKIPVGFHGCSIKPQCKTRCYIIGHIFPLYHALCNAVFSSSKTRTNLYSFLHWSSERSFWKEPTCFDPPALEVNAVLGFCDIFLHRFQSQKADGQSPLVWIDHLCGAAWAPHAGTQHMLTYINLYPAMNPAQSLSAHRAMGETWSRIK